MDGEITYEVSCLECGDYFELSCLDGSLGEIYGKCPHCGAEGDHPIVEQDD